MENTLHQPLDQAPGILDIDLIDRAGALRVDPNRAAVIGFTGALPLTGEVGNSVISAQPGFRYRTDQVDIILTRGELLRLLRHDLRPAEVLTLLEKVGVFHEIHSDFYHPKTGVAFQPMKGMTDNGDETHKKPNKERPRS